MHVNDLKISELLQFDVEEGVLRFAGQRAVIVDAAAHGNLRKELVDQFGIAATRAILTRFGFVQGWRLADAMQDLFQWESDVDWHQACARINMLGGMYCVSADNESSLLGAGLTLVDSCEAEQHVAQLGRSDGCVCWTICGVTSGYLSRALGKEIYVLEDDCIGKGDATCHLIGRTGEQWGAGRADELRYYRLERLRDWIEPSLFAITENLKETEKKLRARKRVLNRAVPGTANPIGMVVRSNCMRRVVDLARRVAKVDSSILIMGESGTGKELIAHMIHDESARASGPFLAVNCGAITESLLESELFGHARGSFTGATQHRGGLFEAANGGTLLLDEIGDISPGMQVKLLRVLQEREIRRVGETRNRPVNVRVIASTNRDLNADIASEQFRKDLFYRLNVIQLHMPPLRDRREDILPLARILLAQVAERYHSPVTGLSPRAADQLLRYEWPGNVRELENAMERAIAIGRVTLVDFDDLPEEVRQAVAAPTLTGPVRELAKVEKDYILAALDVNGGNQARTARDLGIGTATLYRKLKGYELEKATSPSSARDDPVTPEEPVVE